MKLFELRAGISLPEVNMILGAGQMAIGMTATRISRSTVAFGFLDSSE